jgi:hypothetical protein
MIVPNPNNGAFRIMGTMAQPGLVNIAVTDIVGRIINTGQFSVSADVFDQFVSLPAGLPSGLYFLVVDAQGLHQAIRFEVTK